MRLIPGFLLLIVMAGSSAMAQPGIFSPAERWTSENKNIYRGLPLFQVRFKEFSDSMLYKAALLKIEAFKKLKVAPFKVNGCIFINASAQAGTIIPMVRSNKTTINSLKAYLRPGSIELKRKENRVVAETYLTLQQLFAPFYMKQTEVTNVEYREFVYWVKDSIARTLLLHSGIKNAESFGRVDDNGSAILNRKTPIHWDSDDEKLREVLQPLYLPEGERFYNRKEIDTRKLNYQYSYDTESRGNVLTVINIYPDTLAWVHDFDLLNGLQLSMESLTNMYFWHPAYDNCPVTGITRKQAMAYLHWKEQRLREELKSKGIPYEVELDLPSEIEWETVSTARESGHGWLYFSDVRNEERGFDPGLAFKNTDYVLRDTVSDLSTSEKSTFSRWLGGQRQDTAVYETGGARSYVYDVSYAHRKLDDRFILTYNETLLFPTLPSVHGKSFSSKKARDLYAFMTNPGYVSFMNGNVSEWMRDAYFENDSTMPLNSLTGNSGFARRPRGIFEPESRIFPYRGHYETFIKAYLELLGLYKSPDLAVYSDHLKKATEQYKHDYRLVRGANWYDAGDLINGAQEKSFVAMDSAYSTVGFRYVVRFKER